MYCARKDHSKAPTRALVVCAQQCLAIGVDLAHVGQRRKERRPHLFALQQG